MSNLDEKCVFYEIFQFGGPFFILIPNLKIAISPKGSHLRIGKGAKMTTDRRVFIWYVSQVWSNP